MTPLVTGATGTVDRQVVELLGRPPRTHRDFAAEVAASA
jgi:hypothetical protein